MRQTNLEALKTKLFAAMEGIENLKDPNADESEKITIEQAKALVSVADSIIDIFRIQVEAAKIVSSCENPEQTSKFVQGLLYEDTKELKG